MPFVPLARQSPSDFPRVSTAEQASRDADAEHIVLAEFSEDMPADNRIALEKEYRQRFGKEPPANKRGFVPLAEARASNGFVPVADDKPSTLQRAAMAAEPYVTPALKTVQAVASGYPVAETAANLATMGVSLPVAGIAGIGTAAAKALGLTDAEPADVVHAVGNALTYQPKTDLGQHLTRAAMYPFEKLQEVGAAAGDKVLDATGSPAAATAVDTAINALPMVIAPAAKGVKAAREKLHAPAEEAGAPAVAPVATTDLQAVAPATPAIPDPIGPIPALDPAAGPLSRAVLNAEDAGAPGRVPGASADVLRPQKPGIPAGERVAEPRATVAPKAELALDDIPPALLKKVRVPIDRIVGDQVENVRVTAKEALADLAEETGAYRNLLGDVQGGAKLSNGIAKRIKEFRAFDKEEIIEAARVYRARGVPDGEAGIRVIEDHLRELDLQKRAIIEDLIAQFRQRDPERYAAQVEKVGAVALAERARTEPAVVPAAPKAFETTKPAELVPPPEAVAATLADETAVARNVAPAPELRMADVSTEGIGRDSKPVATAAPKDTTPEARKAEGTVDLRTDEPIAARAESAREPAPAVEQPARSGFVPLRDSIDAAAHEAATSPLNEKPQPSPAKIEAGTYAKGHLDLHGLPISIENPKGSIRRGTDVGGRTWETEMQHHYGYIKRSVAKDGDHVDVFIGEHPESNRAFVIDQVNPKTGKYDEAKVVLGAIDEADARRIYQANYEPGWRGAGAVTEMAMPDFREWVRSGDTRKPVAYVPVTPKQLEMKARAADRAAFQEQGPTPTPKQLEMRARQEAIEVPTQRRTANADSSAEPAQDMAAGVQNGTWNPGANYAPFADQMRAPEAKAKTVSDLPDPLRREQIVDDLAKALDTTIYEGRVKGKRRLGFFRPGVDEVRIKRAADIEVAAHEVAHLIDKRVPELQQAWKADKALAAELKSVSYDQKNVKEGFAEGVRLFLTQPDVLEARAPKAYAWLESFTQDHKYGPALRKAQDQMTDWFGQDALNRARSKIGDPGKFGNSPVMRYMGDWWDKQKGQWRQSIVDDLDGIYRMERGMTGKVSPNGPYESARLSRASASIADGAVRFGYPVKARDGSFSWKGRGLEDILKPVAESMDDALLYFVGRSSAELMAQKREHLFAKGEIDGMLNLRTPEREKAFQDYQQWNRGILDFAEAQGIINPESRRLWQRTQYLPFHRVEQPGGLKGKPGEWSGIQALTGGTTNIKDVLGNMVGNAAMLLDKAVKNEARLKVARLSQMEGGGKFMVKIDTESRPVKISGDQVLEAMLKKYGIAIDGDAPAFFEFLINGQPPAGKNVVAVMQKGKPVWFEVGDPILYRALSAIDRPVQSEVVRWLGLPKRVGQVTITLTPDFMMANIARDTLMGTVMSRSGFRPILDSLQGMRLRMTSDPIYKDYIANGGGLSSIYLDEQALRTKLEKFYSRQGIDYKTVLDTPQKLLHGIETIADAFEMSTRLGEYRRAIQRGENPRHAAYQGREVSTDFAMRGDSKALGFMYDTVMFLRPAVVSWDRLYRGLAHDPNKGAIAAKAGIVAMLSAGLYLLNKDDPRYADLPDWDRDTNWHFFIGDQHFRWPKIWEIGALASGAERAVEKIMATDPAGLGKDFARILGATFSVNLMPQILAPLKEQATNRNNFTGAPIETPGMENVQPFLRSKPGTSETMKAAGMATRDMPEALQVNPARAEALLRGYFNTWAMYGLMLSDQALFGDKLPEKRADELPVVRRFYANEPAKHTKFESEFYNMLTEAKRLRGTLKELDEMGYRSYADAKEKSPMAGEAKPLERAAKNLGTINKDMEQVRRDASLTPAEKRQKLDALVAERNALMKASVRDSRAAQKTKTP